MNTFRLHILAADRVFFEGDCTSLIVPTVHGQYGVQARHSNMIAALVPGQLTFRCPDAPERLAAVSAGMIKVEDNDVLVLVDAAERPEDIPPQGRRGQGDSSAKEEPSGVPHRAGHLGPCPEPPAGQGTPGTVKNIPAFPENGKAGMFLPACRAE